MSVTTSRGDIFMAISTERERQDRLHPDHDYPDSFYFTALVEEVGEVAKAMLEDEPKQLRTELVHAAAVCVRMLERVKDSGGERRLEAEAWKEAVKRVRSDYPKNLFPPGPAYRTPDDESAEWPRRVYLRLVEAYAKQILESRSGG